MKLRLVGFLFGLVLLFWGPALQARTLDMAPPIYLSEFQIWAWPTPAGETQLKQLYQTFGRSHHFMLMSNQFRSWDQERIQAMIKEVVRQKSFNLITLGDDHGAQKGHLMIKEGLNPQQRDFVFSTVKTIHAAGLLAGMEPRNTPHEIDPEIQRNWWQTLLKPEDPRARLDVIKLSLEWLGGYQHQAEMVLRVEAAIAAIQEIDPEVLVYLDSLGAEWRHVRQAHRYLLQRFPRLLVNLHGANGLSGESVGEVSMTDMVSHFRQAGFRNIMVQINPNEGSQWFYFTQRTKQALADFDHTRCQYLSMAGANLGYQADPLQTLMQPLKYRLRLKTNLADLRATLLPQNPEQSISYDQVYWESFWTPEGYLIGPLHHIITSFN